MIKVNYTELDGPYGPAMRLEAAGHAGYAPAGQDIVCAGVSTLMQALVSLLAGEENVHSDAFDEPDGPRLTVTAARPCTAWVEGAFELAKAGFALLAERYPDNVRFADRSARGKQEMMDLQLFADGGEAAAPALSAAQEQQAVASGTLKPGEKADAKQETTAPEGEKEVKETEPVKAEEGQKPPRPCAAKMFPGKPGCGCPAPALGCRGGHNAPGGAGIFPAKGAGRPRDAPPDAAARDADAGCLPAGPLRGCHAPDCPHRGAGRGGAYPPARGAPC